MLTGISHLHNFLRWVVLILAVVAVVRYLSAYLKKDDYSKNDDRIRLFFTIFMDTQLLLGLYLWVVKYWDMLSSAGKEVMKNSVSRFWAVEHFAMMLLAVVLVHIGGVQMKKAADSGKKFRKGFIFFGLALLIMLLMIPWPFREAGIAKGLFPGMQP